MVVLHVSRHAIRSDNAWYQYSYLCALVFSMNSKWYGPCKSVKSSQTLRLCKATCLPCLRLFLHFAEFLTIGFKTCKG